jgi:Carboxypeptidase regulatory-like domain/Sigma-54 interaction domain
MNRSCSPLGSVSAGVVMLAAGTALIACNAPASLQRRAAIATLNVSCEPNGQALNCRAIGRTADDRAEPQFETDMTEATEWSTSNPETARVVGGRVTANQPGTASIVASVRSGDETMSSSVLLAVDTAGSRPHVAYDLKGVVRDPSNFAVTEVVLALVDNMGAVTTMVTRHDNSLPDGAFRFVPVLSGQYHLRASKTGYRSAERHRTLTLERQQSCIPHGGAGVRHHKNEEVALLPHLRSPNLLLIGSVAATREFLARLMSSLPTPIVWCDGATPEIPSDPVGSLIVSDVAHLTKSHQERLLDWLNDPSRRVRVIATSTGAVFPKVERGEFCDNLYYRLNTVTLLLAQQQNTHSVSTTTSEWPTAMLHTLVGTAP